MHVYSCHIFRLTIGLFGLVGFAGVALSPLTGRMVDRLVPWYATLVGIFGYMLSQAIQVGAGGINIAAVVIACIGLDLFRQMAQISLTSAVYGIDEKASKCLPSSLRDILNICCAFAGPVEVERRADYQHLHRTGHG